MLQQKPERAFMTVPTKAQTQGKVPLSKKDNIKEKRKVYNTKQCTNNN